MISNRSDHPGGLPSLSAEVVERDGQRVVVVCGELDLSGVDHLWECVERAGTPDHPLVFDLSAVTFMDSSGVNLLVRAYHRQGEDKDAVVLQRPCSQVLRVLELSGVAEYVTVEPGAGTGIEPAVETE